MPYSAGQMERSMAEGNQRWKKIKRWGCEANLRRMKWACVYTSVVLLTIIWSRRNEGGKHGFSLTHYCTAGGDTAAQVEQSAGKWHGVFCFVFFPCHALPGGGLCSINKHVIRYQRLDWSNFLIFNEIPSTWGSRHSYFLYFLKLYWLHIKWLSCF